MDTTETAEGAVTLLVVQNCGSLSRSEKKRSLISDVLGIMQVCRRLKLYVMLVDIQFRFMYIAQAHTSFSGFFVL